MTPLSVPNDASAITPDWVSAILGPTRSIEVEEIGVDFGFGGTTYRVSARRRDGDTQRVVVKFATAERTRRERAFYQRCAPATPLSVPRFEAGAVEDGRGVVVLEYLADMRQGDVLLGSTPDDFLALAAVLARLHGSWWGAAHRELDALQVPLPTPVIREGRLERFLERHGPLSDPHHETIASLAGRLASIFRELSDGPMTLTHRDFHLDNVLFAAGGEPFILDWQGAAVGPPAMDVARLLVECRPPEMSRELVDSALAVYLAGLAAHAQLSDGDLRHQIHLALLLQLAGTINWLGGTPAAEPGSRMEALGINGLKAVTEAAGLFRPKSD